MTTTTSTGHAPAAAWLDAHYLAGQPEYEAVLRSAGFQAGWRVLDAGCGGGSYLPLLGDLLGPDGRLSAVDLAPENVARRGADRLWPAPLPDRRAHRGCDPPAFRRRFL
ncbi:MAG: hypothetical protein HZY76_00075 [Anaerolineae bacterium]|nr:MAG: hypothetical protein HZY76_00075 [Anaerolineae bacterium]